MKNARSFKEEKFFKKGDVFVYVAIAVIIAAIFSVALFTGKEEGMTSAEVYFGETAIYVYSFTQRTGEITEAGKQYASAEEKDGIVFVTINTEKGKNVVEIGADYIKMADADCSRHPDCVERFLPLEKGNGAIVCLPHDIKIVSHGGMSGEIKL